MDMQGNEIKDVKVQYPTYGESSIDKLTSEVLLPLMPFERHQSLVGHSTPHAIAWINDMLPELDQLYEQDVAEHRQKEAIANGTGDVNALLESSSAAVDDAPVTQV
jgi:hypothetical protein